MADQYGMDLGNVYKNVSTLKTAKLKGEQSQRKVEFGKGLYREAKQQYGDKLSGIYANAPIDVMQKKIDSLSKGEKAELAERTRSGGIVALSLLNVKKSGGDVVGKYNEIRQFMPSLPESNDPKEILNLALEFQHKALSIDQYMKQANMYREKPLTRYQKITTKARKEDQAFKIRKFSYKQKQDAKKYLSLNNSDYTADKPPEVKKVMEERYLQGKGIRVEELDTDWLKPKKYAIRDNDGNTIISWDEKGKILETNIADDIVRKHKANLGRKGVF